MVKWPTVGVDSIDPLVPMMTSDERGGHFCPLVLWYRHLALDWPSRMMRSFVDCLFYVNFGSSRDWGVM